MGGRNKDSGKEKKKPTRPTTMAGLAEIGELGNALGIEIGGYTTLSADELKEIASKMEDLDINLKRMKNPQKIAEKIMEEGYKHVFSKALKDHDWAIEMVSSLDGKKRAEFLGLKESMYRHPSEAKTWHRNWTKILHPDNNPGNPKAGKALNVISGIYERMKPYL